MKLALITGAGSGLGLELCRLLKEKGFSLLVTGRKNLPEAQEAVVADLIHERDKVLALVRKWAPELVINNAGFGSYGPAEEHSLDILEVNAVAAIEIAIEAAKVLKEKGRGGTILNVSSAAGEISMPYMALYAASKAALTSFSKSFDAEMRPFGIRVLAALPGQIRTEFAYRASKGKFQQKRGMEKEYVAGRIWKQIKTGKGVEIIDWKVQAKIHFAKMFPRLAQKAILRAALRRI